MTNKFNRKSVKSGESLALNEKWCLVGRGCGVAKQQELEYTDRE